ncbi:hypothetical protein B0J14DRAFT_148184 [Halenospora varia]|nr:hypothetical protein B0J14DRAFT_148184 [Halenospora varia]
MPLSSSSSLPGSHPSQDNSPRREFAMAKHAASRPASTSRDGGVNMNQGASSTQHLHPASQRADMDCQMPSLSRFAQSIASVLVFINTTPSSRRNPHPGCRLPSVTLVVLAAFRAPCAKVPWNWPTRIPVARYTKRAKAGKMLIIILEHVDASFSCTNQAAVRVSKETLPESKDRASHRAAWTLGDRESETSSIFSRTNESATTAKSRIGWILRLCETSLDPQKLNSTTLLGTATGTNFQAHFLGPQHNNTHRTSS